jgi:imidazolonepropionase-like amidohydrolase
MTIKYFTVAMPPDRSTAAVTAILGARALVGDNLDELEDVVVLFDQKIIAVGRDVDIPAQAERVDGQGLTVLPGYLDLHVHAGLQPARRMGLGGVTTARDLGWDTAEIVAERARLAADPSAGPRLLIAGPMLTGPGGYPSTATWFGATRTARQLSSPSHAGEVVAELASVPVDVIKVALAPDHGPVMPEDTLVAVVEAAHQAGLRVTAHISGPEQLSRAISVGVDELAHQLMGIDPLTPALVAQLAAAGTTVISTLMMRSGVEFDIGVANTTRLLEAGVEVLYGTDCGAGGHGVAHPGPTPGVEPRELLALTRAGMSTRDALRSMTSRAARYLGLDEVGVIEPGRRADLVAVLGNPLADIKRAAHVRRVWRDGHAL